MKTTTTQVTKTNIVIEAEADVFIIPNKLYKLNPKYMTELNRIVNVRKIALANNLVYDYEADDVIQLWFVSDDLGSDNLGNHGFRFWVENDRYWVHSSESKILSCLPKKMFEGLREGETRTILIPMNDTEIQNCNTGDEEKVDIELRLTITAAQSKYRYKSFGNFEDTISMV